jgi:hypothetical protein
MAAAATSTPRPRVTGWGFAGAGPAGAPEACALTLRPCAPALRLLLFGIAGRRRQPIGEHESSTQRQQRTDANALRRLVERRSVATGARG